MSFEPETDPFGFRPVDGTSVQESDVDAAARLWDRTVDPLYRTMLDADVVGDEEP